MGRGARRPAGRLGVLRRAGRCSGHRRGVDGTCCVRGVGQRKPLLCRQGSGCLRWSPRQPWSTRTERRATGCQRREAWCAPGSSWRCWAGSRSGSTAGPWRRGIGRVGTARRWSSCWPSLHGRSLHRELVIDALWPDLGMDDAAPRLHKAAHYARRALGHRDAVVLSAEAVRLCPDDDVQVDVMRVPATGRVRAREAGASQRPRARSRSTAVSCCPGPLRAVGRTAPATSAAASRRAAAPGRGLAPGPGRRSRRRARPPRAGPAVRRARRPNRGSAAARPARPRDAPRARTGAEPACLEPATTGPRGGTGNAFHQPGRQRAVRRRRSTRRARGNHAADRSPATEPDDRGLPGGEMTSTCRTERRSSARAVQRGVCRGRRGAHSAATFSSDLPEGASVDD